VALALEESCFFSVIRNVARKNVVSCAWLCTTRDRAMSIRSIRTRDDGLHADRMTTLAR